MSCLIDDIRAFISVNESASLVEFVENNLKSFEDHQFESVEELSKGLKELFEKVYLDLRPSTTKISLDIKAVLIKEAFLYNKITTEAARNALFQWFYLLCENHNVEEFMEKNADMINAVEKTKTSNPKALMDKMSVQLLKHYENLSPNEKNVLRLSLSYIVDMSKNNLAIYKSI
ncbi:hypothetical protein EDC96DRAFT_110927 [Choanephora cucurbitarum]|nr:hypothetical protein EDC96DRAFT_110927 [Choanephora cucurbitarum]